MVIKGRVQAIHFHSDTAVTVQIQGVEENNGWSASGQVPQVEAAELPVGTKVTLTIEEV